MIPYKQFLNDDDPLVLLEAAVRRLETLLGVIGDEGLETPYGEGKWNARQILIHLYHSEANYVVRLRNSLAGSEMPAQPFDPDDWVDAEPGMSAETAVELYSCLRAANLALINSIAPEERSRDFIHPELGTLTVSDLIKIMAGHDLSHFVRLEQIAEIVSEN